MSSFTPGPWTADSENGVEAYGRELVAIAILEPDRKFWGADYRFPEHAEMVANARLMSASPDLLAACEEALVWADTDGLKERLQAAITKAKGG